jgi:hypothetical protein
MHCYEEVYSLYREKEARAFSSPVPLFCWFKRRLQTTANSVLLGTNSPLFLNRITTIMLTLLNETIPSQNIPRFLKLQILIPYVIYPQHKMDVRLVKKFIENPIWNLMYAKYRQNYTKA